MEIIVQTSDGKEVIVANLQEFVGLMVAQNSGTFAVHTTSNGFRIVLGGSASVSTHTAPQKRRPTNA